MQTVTFRSFIAKKEEYNHKETEEQLDQITQRPDVAPFFEILNFFSSIYCNRRVQKKARSIMDSSPGRIKQKTLR